MASKAAKALRRADAITRLSTALDIQAADLHRQGRGDAELALIVTLERVADAVEGLGTQPAPPVTIETVTEKPRTTVETVEVVEKPTPKTKATKGEKHAT